MERAQGTITIAISTGRGRVREETVSFNDLQGLLDACVARGEGTAFVRVQVTGISGGERRRLVLDFGSFGRDEE